jgi:hypothetical protein
MDMAKLAGIFEAVKVIPLRESDLLVFRANDVLPCEAAECVRGMLQEATGHEKILILDHGTDLYVVRTEAEPEEREPEVPLDAIGRHMKKRLAGG